MDRFTTPRPPRRPANSRALAHLGRVLAWSLAILVALVSSTAAAADDEPLYPDLVAQPPDDLYISREVLADGVEHTLLRFTSTTLNAGEGRFELQGDPRSSGDPTAETALYQNVYDAKTGGERVARHRIGANLIFHPDHRHYHLSDYAVFALLRKDAAGEYQPVPYAGGKQSSCILDSERLASGGPRSRHYRKCERTLQGLSVGWADTYSASLPDQWIDLGPDGVLPDGDYAVRYTVDPKDQIEEAGREANNTATTTFTVRDGRIVDLPEPARCSLPEASGPVGATVTLTCSHFPRGALVRVYWGEWDPWDTDPVPPVATFRGATDEQSVTFSVPEAPIGGYNVVARAATNKHETATVIYGVEPSLTASSIKRREEPEVMADLQGFGPDEAVTVEVIGEAGEAVAQARVTTSAAGSAEARLAVPDGAEELRLRAEGDASGAEATAEVTVGRTEETCRWAWLAGAGCWPGQS